MEQRASFLARTYGGFTDGRTWTSTLLLLLSFVTGVLWFIVTLTLVATGVSTLFVWVGIPILLFTFWVVRFAARTERSLIRTMTDIDIADPYRSIPDGTSFWERWKLRATDPATWRDLGYLWLLMPLKILWFAVVVVVWAVPLSLMATPILLGVGLEPMLIEGDQFRFAIDTMGEAWIAVAIGVLLLAVVPAVVRLTAKAHGGLARALLGPTRRSLERQVEDLVVSRDRTLDAAEAERRRIERDLHDGAQVSLVAVAMNLGRATTKFETDPEAAQALVGEAHLQAKQALVELRDLARGIHPAVLSDRGLDAAVSALAGRSNVPVSVVVEIPDDLSEQVESAAYFVIAEALANVAKHAQATRASVAVATKDGVIAVEVTDDGAGGADSAGSGLTGLADRVASLEGHLEVTSPAGGPTSIRVEMPCG